MSGRDVEGKCFCLLNRRAVAVCELKVLDI
jgi:hypothetical protein